MPTVILPKLRAPLLVRLTLEPSLLLSVTAPVKLLFWVKVMAFAPTVKLDVPGTVSAPLCVTAPAAVTTRLPPLVRVSAGKVMPVLLKFKVRLRKLLKLARLLGSAAPE